ncbi:MAG: BadF/BadG/BcrA/BcrD ATPase family protein [Spirochaetales bacterium]
MDSVLIGVDGGGTKTHYLLARGHTVVDRLDGGPTNHEALTGAYDEALSELGDRLHELLGRHGLGPAEVASAAFGLSGVDNRLQQRLMSDGITALGFRRFVVANDGFLAVKAGCRSGFGIAFNAGTGTCLAGIDPTGAMRQVNGLGEFSGDFTGGDILAARTYRAVYDHLFRRGPQTCLVTTVMARLNANSAEELVDALQHRDPLWVRDLVGLLFEAANVGDAVALALVDAVVAEALASIGGLVDALDFPSSGVELVLSGSIHLKADSRVLVERLGAALDAQHPGLFRLGRLDLDPVEGALAWARSLL